MSEKLTVDVVIPTYDGAEFLADAIRSVLSQTITPREIIVVDDGSQDSTRSVLSQFGNKITVVRHQRNKGLPAARNTGIRAGQSPLIAFLDGDDAWTPDKLERQVKEFDQPNPPGLSYTDLLDCNSNLIPLGRGRNFRRRINENVFNELLLTPFPMPPSTVMVSRKVILDCGCFDESMRKVEDYECWLRIAMLSTVSCLPQRLCFRRIHDSSISSSYDFGEKLRWEHEALERCALAAKRFGMEWPISLEDRKLLAIRHRIAKALKGGDLAGAEFYWQMFQKKGGGGLGDKIYYYNYLVWKRIFGIFPH